MLGPRQGRGLERAIPDGDSCSLNLPCGATRYRTAAVMAADVGRLCTRKTSTTVRRNAIGLNVVKACGKAICSVEKLDEARTDVGEKSVALP